MNLREKTVSTSTIFNGKIVKLIKKEVLLPDGTKGTREVVEHPGAVAIVAVDKENYVYLVRQFRSPIEKEILEIPAGKLDEGETPEECARRELQEEIGQNPREMEKLLSYYTSPGFSNEVLHIYLATDLQEVPIRKVEGEFLQIEKFKYEELTKLIEAGEIEDGKTVLGILLASNKII